MTRAQRAYLIRIVERLAELGELEMALWLCDVFELKTWERDP